MYLKMTMDIDATTMVTIPMHSSSCMLNPLSPFFRDRNQFYLNKTKDNNWFDASTRSVSTSKMDLTLHYTQIDKNMKECAKVECSTWQ